MTDEDGRKTWPVNSYSIEGERRTEWFVKDVLKYHRTMATTLNTLIEEGFTLRRVEEFGPTAEQVRAGARSVRGGVGTPDDAADLGPQGISPRKTAAARDRKAGGAPIAARALSIPT